MVTVKDEHQLIVRKVYILKTADYDCNQIFNRHCAQCTKVLYHLVFADNEKFNLLKYAIEREDVPKTIECTRKRSSTTSNLKKERKIEQKYWEP